MKKLKDNINAFLNWIESLFSVAQESQSPQSSKSIAAQELVVVLSQFAASILSSLVASWVVQDVLRYSFPIVIIVAFVLFFFFTTILQTRWIKLKLNAYFIFTTMLIVIITQAVLLTWLYVSTRPPTVYLVFDATEKTKPYLQDVIRKIKETAEVQPINSRSGLRVYGGNFTDTLGCDDTKQLIAPIPIKDYGQEVDKYLGSIEPKGHASLTIAVLQALKNDLKQYRGPIKLIVITSGIDTECEPAQGGIFEEIAKDIRANTRDDVTIVIFSVGKLSIDEMNVLTTYATAYNGKHFNSETVDGLLPLILAPSSYITNYPNLIQPTPTP